MKRSFTSIPFLAVTLIFAAGMFSCNSQTPAEPDPRVEEIRLLEERLDAALQSRDLASAEAKVLQTEVGQLVGRFLEHYPFDALSEGMQGVLTDMGIDPADPNTYARVEVSPFLSLATVHSYLNAYPYHSLPPLLVKKFEQMEIDPSDPESWLRVDHLAFSQATGGFTWASHVGQVEAQSLANARGQEVEMVNREKGALAADLDQTKERAARLGERAEFLEGALDSERTSHEQTRQGKDGVERELAGVRGEFDQYRARSGRQITDLESEKARLARELEIELRGTAYQQALGAANRVVDQYEKVLDEMEEYYQSQLLLVSNFAYRVNGDGTVTGVEKRSGFEQHNVWVRTTPGQIEEDYFKLRWESFRRQVEHAIKLARKAERKSDDPTVQALSSNLEQMLKRIPEKLWISVKSPSGGRYLLDLTPAIEPIMGEIEGWMSS